MLGSAKDLRRAASAYGGGSPRSGPSAFGQIWSRLLSAYSVEKVWTSVRAAPTSLRTGSSVNRTPDIGKSCSPKDWFFLFAGTLIARRTTPLSFRRNTPISDVRDGSRLLKADVDVWAAG
jgi:hypothetical protein